MDSMDTFSFLTFALSVAVLIVFFVMAARLKQIMINTDGKSYGHKVRQLYQARACEVAGDKQGALILYYQILWRYTVSFENFGVKKKDIETKIKELGGDPELKYNELSKS